MAQLEAEVGAFRVGQPEDIRRSAEAGFDAHLVKPIKEPELEALLNLLEKAGVPF